MTAPYASYFEQAHRTVTQELDAELELVEGALPTDLRGALVRNGPGRLERGGQPFGHIFDGDGMISRYAFDGATVRYRNRYVRTEGWVEEERAGKIRFRNFGTNRPGGMLANLGRFRFKNSANTHVIWHGGKLLALWEAGLPHALHPETLETLGPCDFDGRLMGPWTMDSALSGRELPFAAHPRIDPDTGELFGFGVKMGPSSKLMLYRVSPDGQMAPPEVVTLDGFYFVHDFVLTRRWRIFFLCPLTMDVGRALLGLGRAADLLQPTEADTRVLCVPRDGGAPVWLSTRPSFVFHFANGYDDGDRVIIDGPRFDRYPYFPSPATQVPGADCSRPALTRFTLDPAAGTVRETLLYETHTAEMPRVLPHEEGRRHRALWAIGGPVERPELYASMVVRYETDNGRVRTRDLGDCAVCEAVPVARPDGDGAWVLCTAYVPEEQRTHLLVLDGERLDTVARLRLPHAIPPGFHGSWIPA